MSRLRYYNRQGDPLTSEEWIALSMREDLDYKRVGATDVGQLWVSTVWLGLDHGMSQMYDATEDYRPLIFETMVFCPRSWGEVYVDRYSTEAQAIAGHAEAVAYARRRGHGLVKHGRDRCRHEAKAFLQLLATSKRNELDKTGALLLELNEYRGSGVRNEQG